MKRKLVWRALLVAGGLILGVAGAEVAGRLIRLPGDAEWLFAPVGLEPTGLFKHDPQLQSVPTPGFSGVVASLGFRAMIQINSLGMRGPEPSLEAQSRRWLSVGDSFTFAKQVRFDDTFQARLSEATGVQFHNAGMDAYSTWQSTGRYVSLADRVKPQGVLLMYFLGNDLIDDLEWRRVKRPGAALQPPPRLEAPSPPSPLMQFIVERSYLHSHWQMWRTRQELKKEANPLTGRFQDELIISMARGEALLSRALGASRAALLALKQQAARRGHRLMVAVAPPSIHVEPRRLAPTFRLSNMDSSKADLGIPHRAVLALLDELGLARCDLLPALQAAHERGEQLYFNFDGHWNPAGHAVVAKTVSRCLAFSGER